MYAKSGAYIRIVFATSMFVQMREFKSVLTSTIYSVLSRARTTVVQVRCVTTLSNSIFKTSMHG